MKQLRIILLTAAAVLMLSGCELGQPQIPLTEDESNAIAQYCAHLIMKYGAENLYDQRLMDKKDFEDAVAEREALLNPSPTPTLPVTPEPTPDIGDDPGSGPDATSDPVPDVSDKTSAKDASELFDPDTFDMQVVDSYFGKSYKSETEYFTLTAPAGKQVVAFTINVKNITSQSKVFDYNNYGAQFQLVVDGSTALSPEISLLANDFRFNRTEIKPDGIFSGVVLFFADENAGSFIFRILGNYLSYELNINNVAEVDNGN